MFMQVAIGYELPKNYFDLWLAVYSVSMMSAENHWNTFKICLFGQTSKQSLSNFES